jgi:hypothetical protein
VVAFFRFTEQQRKTIGTYEVSVTNLDIQGSLEMAFEPDAHRGHQEGTVSQLATPYQWGQIHDSTARFGTTPQVSELTHGMDRDELNEASESIVSSDEYTKEGTGG